VERQRQRRDSQHAIPPAPQAPPEPLAHVARAPRYIGTGKHDDGARRAAKGRHEALQRTGTAPLVDVQEGERQGQTADGASTLPLDAYAPWTWTPGKPPKLDENG